MVFHLVQSRYLVIIHGSHYLPDEGREWYGVYWTTTWGLMPWGLRTTICNNPDMIAKGNYPEDETFFACGGSSRVLWWRVLRMVQQTVLPYFRLPTTRKKSSVLPVIARSWEGWSESKAPRWTPWCFPLHRIVIHVLYSFEVYQCRV